MASNYLNAKNGIEILHKNGTTQIIAGNFNPSVEGLEAEIGSIFLYTDSGGGLYNKISNGRFGWSLTASGTATKKFLDLIDVPGSYINNSGYLLCINTEGNGLDFTNVIDCGDFI